MQTKIQQLTEERCECVDGQLHSVLVTIMKENSKHVDEVYPERAVFQICFGENK